MPLQIIANVISGVELLDSILGQNCFDPLPQCRQAFMSIRLTRLMSKSLVKLRVCSSDQRSDSASQLFVMKQGLGKGFVKEGGPTSQLLVLSFRNGSSTSPCGKDGFQRSGAPGPLHTL